MSDGLACDKCGRDLKDPNVVVSLLEECRSMLTEMICSNPGPAFGSEPYHAIQLGLEAVLIAEALFGNPSKQRRVVSYILQRCFWDRVEKMVVIVKGNFHAWAADAQKEEAKENRGWANHSRDAAKRLNVQNINEMLKQQVNDDAKIKEFLQEKITEGLQGEEVPRNKGLWMPYPNHAIERYPYEVGNQYVHARPRTWEHVCSPLTEDEIGQFVGTLHEGLCSIKEDAATIVNRSQPHDA